MLKLGSFLQKRQENVFLCIIFVAAKKYCVDRIVFIEENHNYKYKDHNLSSVTKEVGKYSQPFDDIYQSRMSAYKEILGEEHYLQLRKEIFGFNYKPSSDIIIPLFDEYCGVENVEEVQNRFLYDWKMSGVNGTLFHREREMESYARGVEWNPFVEKEFPVRVLKKEYDNESWGMDLSLIEDGYYCEFIVFDNISFPEETLCGTIDRLWIETDPRTGIRYSDTGDYKTNSSPPKHSKYNKMLGPLSHLYSNKMVDYNLQASLYQEMLRTHGFTPRNSSFTHYTDYDVNKAKEYPLVLLQDEAKLILDRYRKKIEIGELF